MEGWQKRFVLNNLRQLNENIRCSTLFTAELLSNRALATEDEAELNAEPNMLKKVKYLLSVLVTKTDGYKGLLKALHLTNQSGARDVILNGVLCNLKIKISGQVMHMREILSDYEIEKLYQELRKKLSASQFEDFFQFLVNYLENDQPFNVLQETISQQPSFYIPRTICKRLRLKAEIFKQTCADIFVLSRIGREMLRNLAGQNKTAYSGDQLDELTAQLIILEDAGDWAELKELNSNKVPMHLIEYDNDKSVFILKESKGSSSVIHRFLETDKKDHDITIEEDKFMHEVENENCKGVCICDIPGMGKTLLLESLARRTEKEGKSIVAFVRLQHFSQSLNEGCQHENPLEVLQNYVSGSLNDLSTHIIKTIMELQKMKLDLFFDGFDEVEEKYLRWTESFLKSLASETNTRVFVTSRPHMRDKLQNLLGVIAFDILPFLETNQIDFFTNFWLSKNTKLDASRLQEFAKICLKEFNENIPQDERDIAGIPLICLLIAEIYFKCASRFSRKNAHLYENWISFGKSMFDIYKMFINTKFESKNDFDVVRIKEEHYRKSLVQIFPSSVLTLLESEQVTVEILEKQILSYGLLHKFNDGANSTHQFIHRTIAEFLVAEYAMSQLVRFSEDDPSYSKSTEKTKSIDKNNCFIEFLFQNVLASKDVDNYSAISVSFTKAFMPRTSHFTFNFPTILYFMEHQLKQTTLSEKIGSILWQYKALKATPVIITALIECCGYQNLVNVLSFIETVVRGSPKREKLSQECLCESMTVVFQFSNVEFVKRCFDCVNNCFSLSLNDIVKVCTEQHWCTPLQYACFRRSYDLMDYFLQKCCSTEEQCLIHFCASDFVTDSHNVHKRIDIITRLISMNPRLRFERDKTNALTDGTDANSELIKFMIEYGFEIAAEDDCGCTLTHCCVYPGRSMTTDEFMKIMVFFMENCKGIDTFKIKVSDGNTPIYIVLFSRTNLCSDAFKLMINKMKPNLNEEKEDEETLILAAVLGGKCIENFNFLIEIGANYNRANKSKDDLLHAAVKRGILETVKLFLKLELDSYNNSKYGNTPIQYANNCENRNSKCDNEEVVKLLQTLDVKNDEKPF